MKFLAVSFLILLFSCKHQPAGSELMGSSSACYGEIFAKIRNNMGPRTFFKERVRGSRGLIQNLRYTTPKAYLRENIQVREREKTEGDFFYCAALIDRVCKMKKSGTEINKGSYILIQKQKGINSDEECKALAEDSIRKSIESDDVLLIKWDELSENLVYRGTRIGTAVKMSQFQSTRIKGKDVLITHLCSGLSDKSCNTYVDGEGNLGIVDTNDRDLYHDEKSFYAKGIYL